MLRLSKSDPDQLVEIWRDRSEEVAALLPGSRPEKVREYAEDGISQVRTGLAWLKRKVREAEGSARDSVTSEALLSILQTPLGDEVPLKTLWVLCSARYEGAQACIGESECFDLRRLRAVRDLPKRLLRKMTCIRTNLYTLEFRWGRVGRLRLTGRAHEFYSMFWL